MKKAILLLISLLLFPSMLYAAAGDCTASGSDWTFETGSSTDDHLQSCIDGADAGDTITLSSGETATWDEVVTIIKGIKIAGATTGCPDACVDNTIINTGSGINGFEISISPGTATIKDQPKVDISGITFDHGASRGDYAILFNQTGSSTDPVYGNFRIHENSFDSYTSAVRYNGLGFGLIDNNYTYLCGRIIYTIGNNGEDYERYNGTQDCSDSGSPCHLLWADLGLGGSEFLFIEDNKTSDYQSMDFQAGQGARVVYRYNTVDTDTDVSSVQGDNEPFDIHGTDWSCPASEIYENDITVEDSYIPYYVPIQVRGGSSIVFNNDVTHSGGSGSFRNKLLSFEEEIGQGYCDGYHGSAGTGYYYVELINTYYWNNTYQAGTAYLLVDDDIGCIATGTDYFADTKDNSTTAQDAYTFYNQAATPGTCTTGDIFWDTDYEKGSGYSTGGLYKCTSTDTWTWQYSPYTYPHPLQTPGEVSGTVFTGAAGNIKESEVVTGGSTIVIDISGTTFTDPFTDQIRANIVAGLNAASSQNATDWSSLVEGDENSWSASGVVRTDSDTVTITLPDFDGDPNTEYSITQNESVTVVLPSDSVASGEPITCTPTIIISNESEGGGASPSGGITYNASGQSAIYNADGISVISQ